MRIAAAAAARRIGRMELDIPGLLGNVENLKNLSLVKNGLTTFIQAFGLFNFFHKRQKTVKNCTWFYNFLPFSICVLFYTFSIEFGRSINKRNLNRHGCDRMYSFHCLHGLLLVYEVGHYRESYLETQQQAAA